MAETRTFVHGADKGEQSVFRIPCHPVLPWQNRRLYNTARYYFDTATGKMAHGKYYRDGAYYYYDTATGIMQYGEQTIDGDEYYFDTDTGAMVTGEVERDGRYYYYDDETGAMLGLVNRL